MQSNESVPDARLQWIFCCEGFFMLNKLILKELCIICIQTGDFMTWMIEPNLTSGGIDMGDSRTVALYLSQFSQHGLEWYAGNVYECVAQGFVVDIVSKDSQIFVVDKALMQHLKQHWHF